MLTPEAEARFWSKVDKNGPIHPRLGTRCWLWTAGKHQFGYGLFKFAKRNWGAHRVSWELTNGPIPDGDGYHGTVVRHDCDVPECCNPAHLLIGTIVDNVHDRDRRGRYVAPSGDRHKSVTMPESTPKGVDHWNAILNPDVVRAIRADYAAGGITQKEAGARHGISRELAREVIHRRIWKHVE